MHLRWVIMWLTERLSRFPEQRLAGIPARMSAGVGRKLREAMFEQLPPAI